MESRRLWWRRTAVVAAAIALAANAIAGAWALSQDGLSLLYIPAHTTVVYEFVVAHGDDPNAADDLSSRVVEILKSRTEFHGETALSWRPLGRNRFEVCIPATSSNSARRVRSPAELTRLITWPGVTEFRIAATPGNLDASTTTQEIIDRHVQQLSELGPEGLRQQNGRYQWFPIHGNDKDYSPSSYVIAPHDGKWYMLLSNSPDEVMLRKGPTADWLILHAEPTLDENGSAAVSFSLDSQGAARLRELTAKHINEPLAILVDDEVYSAPTIRAAIEERGMITGTFTSEELDLLSIILMSNSPVSVKREPVSIVEHERSLPPHATLKMILLVGLAVLAVGGGAAAIWAGMKGRHWTYCWAIAAMAVSWSAWAGVAAWDNFANEAASRTIILGVAISVIAPAIAWLLGFMPMARAGHPDLPSS